MEGLHRQKQLRAIADHAKKLPTRIRTAGLAQSLAFLRAKYDRETAPLRKELGTWVLRQLKKSSPGPDSLLETVIRDHAGTLRRATAESLAWLEWFVRFADAYKSETEEQES